MGSTTNSPIKTLLVYNPHTRTIITRARLKSRTTNSRAQMMYAQYSQTTNIATLLHCAQMMGSTTNSPIKTLLVYNPHTRTINSRARMMCAQYSQTTNIATLPTRGG